MPVPKRLTLLLLAAGLIAVSPAKPQGHRQADQEKALDLLVHAFDRVSPKNVVAIMKMPLQLTSDFQTVEVEIAIDGRQKVTVLQPLQLSGLVILDFGRTRQTYDPDKQRLTTGMSPAADLFPVNERLRLVRRNYTLRLTPKVALAGRAAIRIDATSRYRDFGGAEIYIDPDSFFVLRVDAVSPSLIRTRRFDTTSVSYPASLAPSTFELGSVTITSTQTEPTPVPVKNLAEARRRAGFAPLAPHHLPFGFVIRKTYVRQDPYRSIGFNMSDGLSAATVFEFNANACPKSLQAEMKSRAGDFFRSGDTIVGIVSDLDPAIRKKLLNAFRGRRPEGGSN